MPVKVKLASKVSFRESSGQYVRARALPKAGEDVPAKHLRAIKKGKMGVNTRADGSHAYRNP